MDKLKTLNIVGHNGTHTLKLVAEPPPHMMFLASQVQSANLEGLNMLAAAGGLAAYVVREFDGEIIELPMTPMVPRTMVELAELMAFIASPKSTKPPMVQMTPKLPELPELLDLGRGFIMLAFEKCGSYEELGFVFTEIMGSIKVDSANPI